MNTTSNSVEESERESEMETAQAY